MPVKIAIFYHVVFYIGDRVLPAANTIMLEQMFALKTSGLMDAASHVCVGVNGGDESATRVRLMDLPPKARVVMHGLNSRAENLTIIEIEKFVAALPKDEEWYILYHHSKGATHSPETDYAKFAGRWRRCGMKHCVTNWRQCVKDLDGGAESVGVHWMTGLADGTQNIWGGNFWWARASFLRTVPSMFLRDRIKTSGIAALESRYESEVWIGNAPRLPKVVDYHPGGLGQCP